MKFEKEIYEYLPKLGKGEFAYIKNPFKANVQMLQAGTGMLEELVQVQHDGFACDVHSGK